MCPAYADVCGQEVSVSHYREYQALLGDAVGRVCSTALALPAALLLLLVTVM